MASDLPPFAGRRTIHRHFRSKEPAGSPRRLTVSRGDEAARQEARVFPAKGSYSANGGPPMRSLVSRIACLAGAAALLPSSIAFAQLGAPVPNWAAPSNYTAPHHGAISTMADVTNPLPFIAVSPCRIVDTRGANGAFGGPILAAGATRNFALPNGPCTGIPLSAGAYSLNITVTQAAGSGFILIYPQGGTQPLVSTLNYTAGQTIANAAVVPAGTPNGGVSVVAGAAGTHLIIDINGYYADNPGTLADYFRFTNNSPNYAIFAQNSSGTCQGPCGIRADVLSTLASGAYAIYGFESGNTGAHRGVFGQVTSTSTGAAGVWGLSGLATTGAGNYGAAAVRGDSVGAIGLLGVSTLHGARGVLVDVSGTLQADGYLGYSGPPVYALYGTGNFAVTGSKAFVDPHPERADQVIRYIAMEGPRSYTHITGRARARSGFVQIPIPEDFRLVTDSEDLNAQCTPHGELATCAIVKLDLNSAVFRVSKDVEVSWSVTGIRRTFKDLQPIGEGTEFMPLSPDARMPEAYSPAQRAILVQNGTYNEDGTVNMETAQRMGWTAIWQKRSEDARAAAEKAREASGH
jgi:hypothetical protein